MDGKELERRRSGTCIRQKVCVSISWFSAVVRTDRRLASAQHPGVMGASGDCQDSVAAAGETKKTGCPRWYAYTRASGRPSQGWSEKTTLQNPHNAPMTIA